MSKKEKIIYLLLILCVVIYYILIVYTNIFDNRTITNYLVLGLIIMLGLYSISLVSGREKSRNIKSKDKLFSLLVDNSNTVYIMMNSSTKSVVYLSSNIEKILNIKTKGKTKEEIVFNILGIESIKSEMNRWDKKNDYVSQMIEYSNLWIRLKMYLYKENKDEYYIIEIIDSTKEHDRQHLLITQASNIKTRESVLNEITASSYDMELNINLVSNKYELKYFKNDMKYFGEERRGNYTDFLGELNEYINPTDVEDVVKKLSINNFKNHFSNYELETESIRYRIKDSSWLESTIFFLTNRNNNKVTILTKNVTEDAQAIRQQNVMLQNALNEAKRADKAKIDLIRTISHDIRTPLTNIMGLTSSMLNKELSSDVKEDIKNISDSSNDMLNIIDRLVDIPSIGKTKLSYNEYNVLKLFTRIVNSYKEFANNKGIGLNLNMDTNLPVVLKGDSNLIKEAIGELINNSITYTEEGKVNVNVRSEKKGDNVDLIITIKDTGIGIKEDVLSSIINNKDDINAGYKRIKDIINTLGGKFEIESKENEFTRVTVVINQEIVEDNKIREMMAKNKEAEVFSLKGKKVLVVDDNKLNLKVTSRLLEGYELDLTLVESGEECLGLIKDNNSYDLILLDQMMPGLSGTDVLNELKKIEGFSTPVVVLTADAIDGQKEMYLSAGFNDYISKPIDKSELSNILKKYLKK